MKAKYINPYTDFGFKKLFGEEGSKDLLVDFLNQLLPQHHQITSLSFKNNEQAGDLKIDRRAIFDIHCKSTGGDHFIVEMQKAKINFLKDRALFYMTFPIREQAEKGEWNFKLKPVYCVALLDFEFDDQREQKGVISNVQLRDQYCQTFYDKLAFIFIEMPRFTKKEHELDTHFEKWLYFLKYLETFDTIPEILNEEVFRKGFGVAEIANFNRDELMAYEDSLKKYRDLKGVIDTAHDEGKEEGRVEGRVEGRAEREIEFAKQMKQGGESIEMIMKYTNFSKEEIEAL